MLPRWHIFLGAIFTLILFILFKNISVLYLALVFLSSFLIDFDHYWNALIDTGRFSLIESFEYHKKLAKIEDRETKKKIRRKGNFHLFHTLEFHIFVFLLGFLWAGFWFIFIGMVFHSIIDIISIGYEGKLYRREFFLFNYLKRRSDKTY